MSKNSKVHFLTAYVEYLMDNGVRSEEYYLGDASRFIRYLLANCSENDLLLYIEQSAKSPAYRIRLEKTLKKFFAFASERLAINELDTLQIPKNQTPNPQGEELVSSSIANG